MDTKNHKAISKRDFKLALRALGLELPRNEYIRLVSRIEKDQNGFIHKEIFMKEACKLMSSRDNIENDMIKAFRLIDEEDTGKIDFNSLKNVAKLLGERVSDQEIINMLEAADEDGDGKVNLSEFLKLMNRARKVQ